MRAVQTIGVPDASIDDADAVIVALKSRTVPREQAIIESVAALRWLQAQGCRQFFFKYCSTFDSTPSGNIGPVIDALMAELDAPFTIACPAFPENGRTVLPRPPVRRRSVAVRLQHERPSADADDRCQPDTRAAAGEPATASA